jgi:cytochrome c oxidase cbb3-type subunit 3
MSAGKMLPAICGVLLLVSCQREERRFRELPAATAHEGTVRVSELQPGPKVPDVNVQGYGSNAYAIAEGQQLYKWFNCVGCHANGGGGMGPPLMDEKWIYGSAPENIFDSIVEGRPNGMPSFRGKIPDYKVWQLVAYVRSLSSLTSPAATSPRSDSMSVTPPGNLHAPKPVLSQPVEHP